MTAPANSPYISVLVPVRCDNYAPDLVVRYQAMIDYFYKCQKRYPGLFELCLVEYNPLNDKPIFTSVCNIPDDMDCKIWVVPNSVHKSLDPQRECFVAHGWNFLMRACKGEFVLLTTQDILFSLSLLKNLAKRKLKNNYIYRVDRLDFINPDPINLIKKSFKEIDDFAIKNSAQIHIRHDNHYDQISPHLKNINSLANLPRSQKNIFDKYCRKQEIIYCRSYDFEKSFFCKIIKNLIRLGQKFRILRLINLQNLLKKSDLFGLHTNASGDFILVNREKLLKVRGFRESNKKDQFHNDSFFMAQLTAFGLKQAIFSGRNLIYNLVHQRGNEEMEGRVENNWQSSYNFIKDILDGKIDYHLNQENWGLNDKKQIYKIR